MELSIDTASEMASIALSDRGTLISELTWHCRRNHSVELLPAIDHLLTTAGAGVDRLTALFVCTGPGMYTGLRVGISIAKGLAAGLGLPLLGVGRLELDAYAHRAFPGVVLAVHRAGRGDLAWAAYADDPWREIEPPQLFQPEVIAAKLEGPLLLAGEADETLAGAFARAGKQTSIISGSASIRRAATLAELGYARLSAAEPAEAALVQAVYLRPPAIGPQTAAPSG